jgi:hypothetical protein
MPVTTDMRFAFAVNALEIDYQFPEFPPKQFDIQHERQ